MTIQGIPFVITEWEKVAPTEHRGEAGTATWRTRQFGDIRVRQVECTPGYCSDHWCVKDTFSIASRVSCALTSRTDERSRSGLV
jgi:hypothetical protein